MKSLTRRGPRAHLPDRPGRQPRRVPRLVRHGTNDHERRPLGYGRLAGVYVPNGVTSTSTIELGRAGCRASPGLISRQSGWRGRALCSACGCWRVWRSGRRQGADRSYDLWQVLAAAGPALQRPPLFRFGDGVLDHDPTLGLTAAGMVVEVPLAGPGVHAGLLRREALIWSGRSRSRPRLGRSGAVAVPRCPRCGPG